MIEAHFKTKKNKVKIEKWEDSENELDRVKAEEARKEPETKQINVKMIARKMV